MSVTLVEPQILAGAGHLDGIDSSLHGQQPIRVIDIELTKGEHLVHIDMTALGDPKGMVYQSADLAAGAIAPTFDALVYQRFGGLDPFIKFAVLPPLPESACNDHQN